MVNRSTKLRAGPVPRPPTSDAFEKLFLDEADGHLKSINHAGDITDLEGSGDGGSGVTVDNGTDPPAAVTTLVAPGAVLNEGSATLLGLRLLGPFRANFDDIGIDADPGGFAVGVTIPQDTVVIKAWVTAVTSWVADGSDAGHSCYLGLGIGAGILTSYETNFGASPLSPPADGHEASATGLIHYSQVVTAVGGSPLTVAVYPASGSFTSGALDVYAIIVSPAS
jgi:hypothetical protein